MGRKKKKEEDVATEKAMQETKTPEMNEELAKKMKELVDIVSGSDKDGNGTVVCLIQDESGVHIGYSGTIESVAVMTASAMMANEGLKYALSNAAMMVSMREQGVAKAMSDGEEAPQEPKPTTEA